MLKRSVKNDVEIGGVVRWVNDNIKQGLKSGPVVVELGRPKRNNSQNRKGWALWRDVSRQVEWHGEYLKDYEWKMMFTAVIKKQKTVKGVEGGFIVLSYPSSKLNKQEFSELIELTYAFGNTSNVKWSEDSKMQYEELI